MTTVTNAGVNGVMPFTTDFAGDPSTAVLSPEGLLFYCQSRMSALDTNIAQYFAEQKKANADMKDASRLLEIMHEGTWGEGQVDGNYIVSHPGCAEDHANKANELLALWRSTASPQVKAQCEAMFRQVSGHDIAQYAGVGAHVTPAEIVSAAGNIKAVDATQRAGQLESIKQTQSDMSKSAEMNMIQLQSLVSQRQLAVQLTTQLMQTMHESSKQVLGNIR